MREERSEQNEGSEGEGEGGRRGVRKEGSEWRSECNLRILAIYRF